LQDELATHAALEFVYKFTYQARYGELGSEHELCSVYLGRIAGPVQANGYEIEAIRTVSAEELECEFRETPEQFTPWFLMEWERLKKDFPARLAQFTAPG
jgi:isopentenyl-diphosphate delta-isomerase